LQNSDPRVRPDMIKTARTTRMEKS